MFIPASWRNSTDHSKLRVSTERLLEKERKARTPVRDVTMLPILSHFGQNINHIPEQRQKQRHEPNMP